MNGNDLSKKINKGNTDGMSLKTATGKTFTKEMYEEFIRLKAEGKVKSTFVYKKVIYYQYQNFIIKYDTDNKLAFLLDKNRKRWIYSNVFTNVLLTNINALERLYDFSDTFDNAILNKNEIETLNKLGSYLIENKNLANNKEQKKDIKEKYYIIEDGRIFKLEEDSFSFYQLNMNTKKWESNQNLASLYYDSFLRFQELLDFQDYYETAEQDLNRGMHL